ncbi:MAG: hypothetical protein RLZZ144_786 [Pseudomonadota bacterium]|jgi:thiol:disulfide interchange protein DsbC
MKHLFWLFFVSLSCAQAADKSADPASVALKEKLSKNHGQLLGPIQQVNPSAANGLFEVVTQDQILYVDGSGQFLFDGNLVDLKSRRNLTEERKRQVFAIDFNKLPLELAVVKVKGNGKRKLAYFTDPNCGYCKKLEQELKKVNDVTLYLFLYPIFVGSADKVESVWCSKDRANAWDDLMLNGIQPIAAKCNNAIAKVTKLGARFHINGTPALIFSDGALVPGYMPAADLENALNAAIH